MSSNGTPPPIPHRAFLLEGWQTLRVSGPDRLDWLNGLVTCNVKSATTENATWGLALDRHGKIQTVLAILSHAEELLLALSPGTREAVHSHLDRMLIMEDAELLPDDSLAWLVMLESSAGAGCERLMRVGGFGRSLDWLNEPSVVGCVPRSAVPSLFEAEPIVAMSEGEWTWLRLEAGLPEFGRDITNKERPHEAGLERRTVDWNKGCYLGQEVVCMQDMRGKVKRRCRVLRVQAPSTAELVGAQVYAPGGDQALGSITSAAASLAEAGQLAMGILRLEASNDLELRTPHGTFQATGT